MSPMKMSTEESLMLRHSYLTSLRRFASLPPINSLTFLRQINKASSLPNPLLPPVIITTDPATLLQPFTLNVLHITLLHLLLSSIIKAAFHLIEVCYGVFSDVMGRLFISIKFSIIDITELLS